MSPSPAKSTGKVPEIKLLLMSDLTPFINKIEDVVDILLGQCEQAFPALLHALENDGPPSLASQLVMMPTLGQA